ncbi:MAG: metal ABC transporter permease, partial [Candidatus Omnitrophica bacterium]|nr:metal ABC transporter permease [Candidatus Omnitrophota bacterium]
MIEALQYEFMRNALMAALLASLACGVIGTYVVVKRISFISGAIAHAAFGGVGIGYFLGVNPVLTLLPFSVLSALCIGLVSKKTRLSEDSAIGMFWAVGMAIGILFVGLTPGYTPDLFSYIFGNILTVPLADIAIMAALDLIILISVALLYKEFLAVSFDEEYAEVSGLATTVLYLLMLCLVAITVVVLIRVVGIVLVIALLTIPASIAREIGCFSLRRMMVVSSLLGGVFTMSGLALSYMVDIPSGAAIILVSATAFIVVAMAVRLFRLLRLKSS